MNMNTQSEISLLADQDLDAVVGGRMATGMDPKPLPGGSVHAGNAFTTDVGLGIIGSVVLYGLAVAIFA
jgi:hypothetical protein